MKFVLKKLPLNFRLALCE